MSSSQQAFQSSVQGGSPLSGDLLELAQAYKQKKAAQAKASETTQRYSPLVGMETPPSQGFVDQLDPNEQQQSPSSVFYSDSSMGQESEVKPPVGSPLNSGDLRRGSERLDTFLKDAGSQASRQAVDEAKNLFTKDGEGIRGTTEAFLNKMKGYVPYMVINAAIGAATGAATGAGVGSVAGPGGALAGAATGALAGAGRALVTSGIASAVGTGAGYLSGDYDSPGAKAAEFIAGVVPTFGSSLVAGKKNMFKHAYDKSLRMYARVAPKITSKIPVSKEVLKTLKTNVSKVVNEFPLAMKTNKGILDEVRAIGRIRSMKGLIDADKSITHRMFITPSGKQLSLVNREISKAMQSTSQAVTNDYVKAKTFYSMMKESEEFIKLSQQVKGVTEKLQKSPRPDVNTAALGKLLRKASYAMHFAIPAKVSIPLLLGRAAMYVKKSMALPPGTSFADGVLHYLKATKNPALFVTYKALMDTAKAYTSSPEPLPDPSTDAAMSKYVDEQVDTYFRSKKPRKGRGGEKV